MNEFDLKAAGWDENPVHVERAAAITGAILNTVPVTKEMTALEFGAGTGIAGLLLSDHVKKIVLTDSSIEMVRIMKGKIRKGNVKNLRARLFDLEKNQWTGRKFDLVTSQMVLHHIADIEDILEKFHDLLRPGGFLTLADLYKEDGSFHGEGFTGHNGFDTVWLSEIVARKGFRDISVRKCFEIKKQFTETEIKQFDVFLLAAVRI
jgi:2-polyprenyl-3-methyl-5-hydroxy-6-metoxy-1,4-benzoquinol methylase